MINKKSLWFLTLFSLILVLSVYYVTMPSELLLNTTNGNYNDKKDDKTGSTSGDAPIVEVNESAVLVALRIEAEEQMLKELDDLKSILTDTNTSVDEKNNAYEKMKNLNITRGEEEKLEQKVLDEFKLKAFVKIDGDQIRIVVSSENHDTELANNIMRSVQSNFNQKMYISVKFQK